MEHDIEQGDEIAEVKRKCRVGERRSETTKRKMSETWKIKFAQGDIGRRQQGRPDHVSAKHWVIESPERIRYEFANLTEWCRQNEHLFPPDTEEFKKPLWARAAHGIHQQASVYNPHPSQWKGWRLISVTRQL